MLYQIYHENMQIELGLIISNIVQTYNILSHTFI